MADVGVGGLRLATVRTASGTAARAAVIDARAPRTSSAVAHPLPFADGADALRAWAAADAERAARGDARMPPSRMLQEALDACDPAGALPLPDVELLPPVASSRNAFAIGLNYGEHGARESAMRSAEPHAMERTERRVPLTIADIPARLPCLAVTEVKERFQGDIVRRERPSHPVVFTKAQTAAVGAGAPIELPPPAVSSEVDYEGELGVVLLRGGKAIEKEHALEHVFGYSVINDVTARDMQRNHQQWHLGKSCDTFMPHGPCVPARVV